MMRRLLPADDTVSPPLSRERWRDRGYHEAWERALTLGPQTVIEWVTAAGLTGRGGAAFPTGQKWASVAQSADPVKYVVMNADESELGTFKDRALLTRDPWGALAGLAIAAFAVGAHEAYVYLRGEYADVERLLEEALALAPWAEAGSYPLAVRLIRGAGAYIAGEETALLNSIEGRRPEPRVKPPFPTARGLWGHPTVIQNVETLANVAVLLAHDVAWFRAVGTEAAPGTKLMAVSGHVARPGVYEIPMGLPLWTLLTAPEYAGGIGGSGRLRAVLLGGAAGTFLTADECRAARLDNLALQPFGASLGSGAVMVFDDTVEIRQVVRQVAGFFAEESCGQCVPCRIGTRRLLEQLSASTLDIERLRDLGGAMRDASICGLGQTAPQALLSYLDRPSLWPRTSKEEECHA
ncbi:MAG: electron transport complex protein RnfC [Firmicutes bacterium]|nr:electron transport complex protein RnfC [Bacillota bacterium]